MKSYIYIQSSEILWQKIAEELYAKGIAKPVLWIGGYEDKQRIEVLGAEIIEFYDQYSIKNKTVYEGSDHAFDTSRKYHYVKEICIKMMDREDLVGNFRNIDRECFFNYWLIVVQEKLKKHKPDFLLMSESPHSFLQYLIYEVCKFKRIPIFSFGQITKFAPVLYLRKGIEGKPEKIQETRKDLALHRKIIERAKNEINKEIKNRGIVGAKIMEYQIFHDNERRRIKNRIKKGARSLVKKTTQIIPQRYSHRFRKSRDTILQELDRRLYTGTGYRWQNIEKTQSKIWKELKYSYDTHATNTIPAKYIYLTLHYEPERNSCPDGLEYHEQVKIIKILRRIAPTDVTILVKEHPSQFLSSRMGYQGRSPFFYEYVSKIEGVQFVTINNKSEKLIQDSLFTASIGGTSAIESSFQGKIALVFGNPWFIGCPNIIKYDESVIYTDILNYKIYSQKKIVQWIENFIDEFGIPGVQNPSGLRNFSDMNFQEIRTEATHLICDKLKGILIDL